METMPTKITHALKYVNVLPQERCSQGGGQKIGWAFWHLGEECLLQGAKLISQWGEGAFPRDG
jgi:hypothetical protein